MPACLGMRSAAVRQGTSISPSGVLHRDANQVRPQTGGRSRERVVVLSAPRRLARGASPRLRQRSCALRAKSGGSGRGCSAWAVGGTGDPDLWRGPLRSGVRGRLVGVGAYGERLGVRPVCSGGAFGGRFWARVGGVGLWRGAWGWKGGLVGLGGPIKFDEAARVDGAGRDTSASAALFVGESRRGSPCSRLNHDAAEPDCTG